MAPPKVMLLTGPPPWSSVTENSCSIDSLQAPFTHLLGVASKLTATPDPVPRIAWRSLHLERRPLQWTPVHLDHSDASSARPDFFNIADVSSASLDEDSEVLAQFCEESFAAHEDMTHSLIESFDSDDTSFRTTASTPFTGADLPAAAHLSDLEDVPSARRVLALQPQTVTLNLIAGVISISQPRSVTTRWGKAVALVEILVGDDTASGFGITFWLGDGDEGPTSSTVRRLRRQDVVLLQNVGLHVFRGKVYGQSLSRNVTKIDLLWRVGGDGFYSNRALANADENRPQQTKTRLVKEWALNFVGQQTTRTTRSAKKSWDRPPKDTQ